MALIANGEQGLRRTLSSATIISGFLALVCYQSASQIEGRTMYWATATFAAVAWQFLLRFALGTINGSYEDISPSLHILAAILSFVALAGMFFYPALICYLAVAIVAAVADLAFVILGR